MVLRCPFKTMCEWRSEANKEKEDYLLGYNTFDWRLLIYCWGYLVQRNQWIHARPHTLSTSLLPTGKPHTTALISTHPHTHLAHTLFHEHPWPLEEHEVGGNHVKRQPSFKLAADFLFGCLFFLYDVGHQELVFPFFTWHQHRASVNHRQGQQSCFHRLRGNDGRW